MSQPGTRETLHRRALKAMIESAVLDWKSAVILAMTLLLTIFAPNILPGWQWWYWVLGGAVAWGALLVSMLTDPAFEKSDTWATALVLAAALNKLSPYDANVMADMLRTDLDPARLKNEEARARINKALEYRRRIAEAFGRARQNILPDDLKGLEHQIDEWIANMYHLATRLDTFESDTVIHQDLQAVPQAIQNLQAKLKTAGDQAVREQIQQTLAAKQQQLDSLRKLESMMQKASLQMDSTITALGTVYSQLLLIGVKDIDSGRARRLREDISEQVHQLHDLVSSVDEVYAHRA